MMDLEKLKKPLPTEAITQHPTKTYLSSIKAIYVTERFNEVFWVGKWTVKTEFIENAWNGMIVVKVIFEVPELWIYYESFWGNDNGGENNKNFDLWDAYKWATTDALTKIGSYLWVGIDVFKWKQKAWNGTPTTGQTDNKPWLNINTDWELEAYRAKMLEKWMDSKTFLEEMKKHYKISKANQDKILWLF